MIGSAGEPHSRRYLGNHRTLWWNPDFVHLLCRRAEADSPSILIDVGIGQGEWTDVLLDGLRGAALVVGIDREESYLGQCAERFRKDVRLRVFHAVCGDASSVPLAGDLADVVTCQTLLMHCSDPAAVTKEFYRILRPGGAAIVVEPCNLANRSMFFELLELAEKEELTEILSFWKTYHDAMRSKLNINHDIGLRIGELFSGFGFTDVHVYHNDRVLEFASDNPPTVVDREYNRPEIVELVTETDPHLVQAAARAFETIARRYQQSGRRFYAPLSMFILIARKRAGHGP